MNGEILPTGSNSDGARADVSAIGLWQPLRREGGSGVKKTSLAYIKVQPVMELLLFTESQNLRL